KALAPPAPSDGFRPHRGGSTAGRAVGVGRRTPVGSRETGHHLWGSPRPPSRDIPKDRDMPPGAVDQTPADDAPDRLNYCSCLSHQYLKIAEHATRRAAALSWTNCLYSV